MRASLIILMIRKEYKSNRIMKIILLMQNHKYLGIKTLKIIDIIILIFLFKNLHKIINHQVILLNLILIFFLPFNKFII